MQTRGALVRTLGIAVLAAGMARGGRLAAAGGAGQPAAVRPGFTCAPAPASPKTVKVKDPAFGARGDGASDDTGPIQKAIDAVAGTGGTVLVPPGTYLINALARNGRAGLALGSDMTLLMAPGAVLKAIPNAAPDFSILLLSQVRNVNVLGGTLEGERDAHLGREGEWGMGLQVSNSQAVVVEAVTARNCWGDGFYVANRNQGITFCRVAAERNRRQGMSIVGGEDIVVRQSTFKDTAGTAPECGIDVEPNRGQTVANLLITECTVTGNAGGGIAGGPAYKDRDAAFFTASRISRNKVSGNKAYGIIVSACTDNVIEGNQVAATEGYGILLRGEALRMTVTGNTVTGSRKDGIYLEDCDGTQVSGNTVTGSGGYGINRLRNSGATVGANTLAGNVRK
jgi:parallel beta-helix repeat protein